MARRQVWVLGPGIGLAVAVSACCQTAHADIDPNSGIDFVRVGALNNPAWPGTNPPTPGDRAVGRGGVNYEYSIGKFEVTTAQWVEFFNAAYDRPDAQLPHLFPPSVWGAQPAPANNPGGRRWRVPAGNEMIPVGNISWRMAAMLCNWYHNGKATNREAFLSGAYDVSTFGAVPGFPGIFSDQFARSPGARYFIPSWDEWLKAAHYDPNKLNGDGSRGGWWLYSTTSDTAPISNPPGSLVSGANGQVNAGGWQTIYNGVISPFAIPLGAYANVTSPWGLFDTAGATNEWTEEVRTLSDGQRFRTLEGSNWVDGSVSLDAVPREFSDLPNISTFDYGFRIASVIPAAGSLPLLVFAGAYAAFRRRRSATHAKECLGNRLGFSE